VAEEWEGHGIGPALLRVAEEWAKQRGLDVLTVETGASNNRAQRLYRSKGFEPEDVRFTKRVSRNQR
jgi:ribosomal protein S18 acetylase RimI-like enzyme